MAEGQGSCGSCKEEKDLEEGEIDDLEEGEIDEDVQGVSEYRFNAREEKSTPENVVKTRDEHDQVKPSQSITLAVNNQRNSSRNTKHSRNNNEERTHKQLSRSYEKTARNRGRSERNFVGRRTNVTYRVSNPTWSHQNPNTYPTKFDNNFPVSLQRNPAQSSSPVPRTEQSKDFDEQFDNEDFEFHLEQYKRMQEKLDEIGQGGKNVHSLEDEIIDDTFVDIPLDDVTNTKQSQDDLDEEIRQLELDFSQNEANTENPVHSEGMKYPQTIPTTYEQNLSGAFEPFKIKTAPKKVRKLSELNRIDMLARGITVDNEDQAKSGNLKSQVKNRTRRRAKRNERRGVKRKELSNSKMPSSDVNEELSKTINGSQTGPNSRAKLIRKEKAYEWNDADNEENIEVTRDDYIEAPMEVETDSAEGVGMIEQSYAPFEPQVELAQLPHSGENVQMSSTSHLMALMDVKPYGHFHDYESQLWGGGEFARREQTNFERSTAQYDDSYATNEESQLKPAENSNMQTRLEQDSLKGENVVEDDDEDDEASVLALREQLLQSMVNKRAAKNAGTSEKTATSSKASPSNSRTGSPFREPGGRTGHETTKNDSTRLASVPTKVNFAPPKHEPVVIHLGADSEESESDGEGAVGQSSLFFGGLDSFIKEARERSSKLKNEEKIVNSDERHVIITPTTPEIVSALPEGKRNEYKKLKLKLALKKQQQQQQQQQQPQPQQQHKIKMKPKQANSAQSSKAENAKLNELKVKITSLNGTLIAHKKSIMQDEKLLENCKNQLDSSAKALSEHEKRVELLQQQVQRAERLKKVQEDLVGKLQIQNARLRQRMLRRQAEAREVEARLLHTRALLVSKKSRKSSVIATGEKPQEKVKPAISNPGEDAPDGMNEPTEGKSRSLNEARDKFQEMSRILDESVLSGKKQAKTAPSDKIAKDLHSMSKLNAAIQPKTSPEDEILLEKKRLRILEQNLSQRLRQKRSASPRKAAVQHGDERASSDSELVVKRAGASPRGLTPPVKLLKGNGIDKVDGGLGTLSKFDLFKDIEKLKKVRESQMEREVAGPCFANDSDDVLLPARFRSTKCAWLSMEDISLSENVEGLTGCLSAAVAPSLPRCEVTESRTLSRRATGPYKSPLAYFRSYRFSPYYRTKTGYTLDSPTFTHLINHNVPLCPFALQGICSDPKCTHQHPDDVMPKDEEILQDLAAYFAPARKTASGDDDVIKTITGSIDAVTKQYGGKVSPAELRVLFVNHLRKQKAAGIYNIVLERRPWRPSSYGKNDPGANPLEESQVVRTETSFSWKNWKRKIESQIKTRPGDRDECQEVRYFSETYDSVKTLEKATQENPSDEALWLRLAMVHMGLKRTDEDKNNNGRKNVDKALNTLAQALERNRHSEKLWLKYLDIFRHRATTEELHEVCDEAIELAGSHNLWWTYLEITTDYNEKANVCLKFIRHLISSETDVGLKSHRLLEVFLYLVQLDLFCDRYSLGLNRLQAILLSTAARDDREGLASLVDNLACDDLCWLWLCYIHLVEFACLPREFYDSARSGPSRIVRKDVFVFPWKPGGGTRHDYAELVKLFQRGLKESTVVFTSSSNVSPVFCLCTNLIALHRTCGKPFAIRRCQQLLKASPKNIEHWLCVAALQQVSGDGDAAIIDVYKKALEYCDGHAKIAYSAAKYCLEKKNRDECYEALTACVYSKFTLLVPSPGPKTRARSQNQPMILRPNPELLYKKLLSLTLPLDSQIPSLKPGVRPRDLGSEGTYVWLCYCMFVELFSDEDVGMRHSLIQSAYESAINSTHDRNEAKSLWTEYLYYMARRRMENLCTSEELHDVFHKCLSTVPAVTPLLHMPSRSWSDYSFHNEVLALYRRCLGNSFSSDIYEKYLEMFPDNSQLAIQAVKCFYENKDLDKARKILSAILLKTPFCEELWKIAISIELKAENFDQARQLYQHATEALPLAATIWKDFVLFELAHGSKDFDGTDKVVSKANERGIDLARFLNEWASKDR